MSESYQPTSQQVYLGVSQEEPELGQRALLRTYDVAIPETVLREAKEELTATTSAGVGKFNARGEDFQTRRPKTATLSRWLASSLLEQTHTDLSFIRASQPQEHVFADNLHFDARYVAYSEERGINNSFWRPSNAVEIWRQVINLNDSPRHLQMIDASIPNLEDMGIDLYAVRPVGRNLPEYDRPEDVPQKLLTQPIPEECSQIYTIPAYDGENLAVLEFWSSRVLHAGIGSKDGQLMAAAGKWVQPNDRDEEGYYAR